MKGSPILSVLVVIFALAAGYFGYWAFATPTSVVVDGAPVASAELMHYQSQNLVLSLGLAILAAILHATSAIVGALNGRVPAE
jgi:hypothetical protein